MAKVQNGKENNIAENFNSLSRAHERYRRQMDLRQQRPERSVVTVKSTETDVLDAAKLIRLSRSDDRW